MKSTILSHTNDNKNGAKIKKIVKMFGVQYKKKERTNMKKTSQLIKQTNNLNSMFIISCS